MALDTDDLPTGSDHLRVWGRFTLLVVLGGAALWAFTPATFTQVAVLALLIEGYGTVKIVQSWAHWGSRRALWWWR